MILVTAAEMRALDDHAIRTIGIPGAALMESAGRSVAEVVTKLGAHRIAVVAGSGNNGGDGCVCARYLHQRGTDVVLLLAVERGQFRGDAALHLTAAERAGVPICSGMANGSRIDQAELVVDALFGTGLSRPVEGELAAWIDRINRAPGIRVAVDLPSGLHADRGIPLGACVQADHTITFAFAKLGLVTAPGFHYAGQLHVADIGIAPPQLPRRHLLDDGCLEPLRAPRTVLAHKGTFGHALLVAGSRGRSGAAWLAGEACARAGAGLVTVATSIETQSALMAHLVEVMTASLGAEPIDPVTAWTALAALCQGKRAIAFGPGLGTGDAMRQLMHRLLEIWKGPLVCDADGLTLLASDLAPLDRTSARVVLTPHPGEMARLCGTSVEEIEQDRVGYAEAFAAKHACVVVLKGARTVIAAPDRTAISPAGNPGMASGGTGDALTGIVAALLAQGWEPFAAATMGVYWHGRAGDLAAKQLGERGLLARDLIAALPRVATAGGA